MRSCEEVELSAEALSRELEDGEELLLTVTDMGFGKRSRRPTNTASPAAAGKGSPTSP